MKKLFVLGILVLSSLATVSASITINLGGGNIYSTSTATLAPPGSLIQIVASTADNIFTDPTSTSFTGGSADDVVIASFVINAGLGSPGTFAQAIIFNLSATLTTGDLLLLRWFPTLTIADATGAPPAGTPYGQFRTDAVENFSDIAWVVPADNSIVSLNFLTLAQGGTRPESDGVAKFTVIPEPSTYALLAVGLAVVAFSRRRLKLAL